MASLVNDALAVAGAVQHGGAEGGLVERDGLGAAIDPQLELDAGHVSSGGNDWCGGLAGDGQQQAEVPRQTSGPTGPRSSPGHR